MSPYEHQARERKATKIADHAFATWSKIMNDYDAPLTHNALSRFVLDLASASESMRLCFAVSAGTKKPSAATWLLVVDLVGRRGTRAIAEEAKPADAFAGLTEADTRETDRARERSSARPRTSRSLPASAVLYI